MEGPDLIPRKPPSFVPRRRTYASRFQVVEQPRLEVVRPPVPIGGVTDIADRDLVPRDVVATPVIRAIRKGLVAYWAAHR